MTQIHKILTHVNPDIDAILSVLLLQLYGEKEFPGVSSAKVEFCPAGILPGGLSPDELESAGIISVDTGGGRFDTHPGSDPGDQGKVNRSASDLVAESIGVINEPQWADLVEFVRLHDSEGRGLLSTDPVHHFFTIPNILTGMAILFESKPQFSSEVFNHGSFLLRLPAAAYQCRQNTPVFNYKSLVKDIIILATNDNIKPKENSLSKSTTYLEWMKRLDNDSESAVSTEKFDQVLSLPTIIQGLYHITAGNIEQILKKVSLYLQSILAREQRWIEAIAEIDSNVVVRKVGKKILVAQVLSKNGLIIKALRMRVRADLIIYRNPNSGATSILIKRKGPLKYFRMPELTANIRIAECIEQGIKPDYKSIRNVGKINGWFLHQSTNLIIRGSQKATDFIPSLIPLETLTQIAISKIDSVEKIPAKYCPDNRCTLKLCMFYRLHLQSCKNHRMRLEQGLRTDTSKILKVKLMRET